MPVVFISHGYDTTPAKPYTEDAWANAFGDSFIGSAKYGVNGPGDWKVTAVASATRTVSIAAGGGWGAGVTDTTSENETLQFAPSASGSRWDTVVVRRDWTPTAGISQFAVVEGGSSRAVSGSRLFGPGDIDDQPIALVQIKENQTQPEAVVDLRCWAANGGVVAKDVAALTYLARLGARVRIGNVTWSYGMDNNDTPGWSSTAPVVAPIALNAGYASFGGGYDPAVHTERMDFGRVFSEGVVGASGSTILVDKARPHRYKLGTVASGHRPPFAKEWIASATPTLGIVTVYLYPNGEIEWECTQAPGVMSKTGVNGFFIGFDDHNWPVA
ncbi:virion structural protein [Arthrobacter phage Kumotta]|uniref:Minor tail protein n=2 Tax=Kumottavirus TaxID=3044749 RepID=A0A4Y6ELD0_9CAUD|nr:virion structural protein [Arthrobacter phage Kumotta]YP_010649502.1 virion structural protein [Arthrobacter phage MargaretKali]AXH44400.1 hypothetical protein SEA_MARGARETKALI_20 [Arthrobacter phage MargaretKali]QDF19530.1 hypothetical protein SEA_KUMOTTA_20 [Arthrobacter phage Kumotta]